MCFQMLIFIDQHTDYEDITINMIILLSHCLDFFRLKRDLIEKENQLEHFQEMKTEFIKQSLFIRYLSKLAIKMSKSEQDMNMFSRIFMNISLEDISILELLITKEMPVCFIKILSFSNADMHEDILFAYSNLICVENFHYLLLKDELIHKVISLAVSE